MSVKPVQFVFALAIAIAISGGARAQDNGKVKDEALESLLKELAEPAEKEAPKSDKPAKADGQKAGATKKEA